jgi:hypothetical protein
VETSRYCGWYILLAYAGCGALITKDSGTEGLRKLLLTFAGAGAAIAVLEILLLTLNHFGLQSTLPLTPYALQGFSLNHSFFAFQLLMALAAVFVAARGQALRIALIAALFAALYFTDSRSSWITVLIVVATGIYMKAATFREIGIALVCTLAIVLPRRRAVV